MPIVWTGPGQHYDHPGMAVPCHLCGAEAGHPCSTRTFAIQRPGSQAHTQREDLAEAIGFARATRQTYLQARHVLENLGALVVQPDAFWLGGEPEPRIGEAAAPAKVAPPVGDGRAPDLFDTARMA